MGYDLVTWAPRKGSTGDSQYNLTGCTQLDGSIDTGVPTPVWAGDASGFSATPLISEINLSSDWNQMLGLYNRRVLNFNNAGWKAFTGSAGNPSTISYLTQGLKVKATDIVAIQNGINKLRAAEGFAAYTFSTVSARNPVLGKHLAECRKALRIAGVQTQNLCLNNGSLVAAENSNYWIYQRKDTTYGATGGGEVITRNTTTGLFITVSNIPIYGKQNIQFTPPTWTMLRARLCFDFPILDWVANTYTCTWKFLDLAVQTTMENWGNVELYTSNTDDVSGGLGTGYNGMAYNTNNLVSTLPRTSIVQGVAGVPSINSMTFDQTFVNGAAGRRLSFVMGTDNEIATAGSGVGSSTNASGWSPCKMGFSDGFIAQHQFLIDFGV